jgi:hypothetical protein
LSSGFTVSLSIVVSERYSLCYRSLLRALLRACYAHQMSLRLRRPEAQRPCYPSVVSRRTRPVYAEFRNKRVLISLLRLAGRIKHMSNTRRNFLHSAATAAAVPSPSRAWCAARDRVGFGLRPVACGAFFPSGGGGFNPARLALDSPMVITCLAERAPCLPSRTCSTSSRTYSPACLDGDLAFRTGRVVFFSGKATVPRRRAAFSLLVFPIRSGAVVPEHLRSPGGIGHIRPIAFIQNQEPSPVLSCPRPG